MDKLKPIIEQKFWIFLGLALLCPFIGWYLATSSYAKGVEEREQLIESTFNKVNFSGDIHNQLWVDGADAIVKVQEHELKETQKTLWVAQKQGMDWPVGVDKLMKDVPYEGKNPPVNALELYSQGYFKQLSQIEEHLRPFDYNTGKGVLLFQSYQYGGDYTHVPNRQWDNQPPTPTEMWNAQIDLWLVRAIFDSIVSMNQGAEKITEAPVRQLLELTLRGGVRNYGGEGSGGTGGTQLSGGAGGGDYGGGDYGGGDYGGASSMFDSEGYGATGSGSSGGVKRASAKFDLSEELGPAGNDGYGRGSSESMEDVFSDSAGSSGDTAAAAQGPGRYVDDDESYPFRTRAFVLGVIMDHRDLPEFMSQLSRSDWPIQIIRVQMAAYKPDTLPQAGRSGTASRAGISGMSPGGFGSSSFGSGSYNSGSYDSSGSSEGYSSGGGSNPYGSSLGSFSRPSIPGALSAGADPAGRNASGLVDQAMSDPYLAEVWIGGLITLFRPVEADETAVAESPGATAGAVPGDPSALDGNATSPGGAAESTDPADPAAGPAGEVTPDPDNSASPAAPAETGSPAATPGPGGNTPNDNN